MTTNAPALRALFFVQKSTAAWTEESITTNVCVIALMIARTSKLYIISGYISNHPLR